MADIFNDHNGRGGLPDQLAHLKGVKLAVRATAEKGAAVASARLEAHRDTGDARITVQPGVTDVLVTLDDDRGQRAAMTIEFGRAGGNVDSAGRVVTRMEGLHVLTGAFGV